MKSRGFNMNPHVRFSWRLLGILLLARLFLSSVVIVNQRLDGAPHWLLDKRKASRDTWSGVHVRGFSSGRCSLLTNR